MTFGSFFTFWVLNQVQDDKKRARDDKVSIQDHARLTR